MVLFLLEKLIAIRDSLSKDEIEEITEQRAESKDIYDLQGRKVTAPVKGGLYIQNGNKFIAR